MKSCWVNWLPGVIALLLSGGQALAQAQPDVRDPAAVSGQPKIVAIRIVRLDGQLLSDHVAGIPLQPGDPVDRGKIAESLRALYKTGDYADLQAVVTPVSDGVRLDFVVQENLFFNQVRISGLNSPPTEASAAAAMQLGLGLPYQKAAVNEALDRLQDNLREEGLYQAGLTWQEDGHAETHQMDILVRVQSGLRARVGVIHLTNNTSYPDAVILARFKMKTASEITSAKLQRGIDRIRKYLLKHGHLAAKAYVRREEYDAAKNTVPLDLEVTEGPRVQVNLSGAKFSNGELKRLIPIYQEGAVDADLLEESKRNILERLERQGYFDAAVDYATETHQAKSSGSTKPGEEETITYTVRRGVKHKLVGIEITGNKYFNTELLKSRLQIFGGAFGSSGRFSRRLVDSDTLSMRALYQANGFLDAKVEEKTEDDYKEKKGDVFIRFVVQEGKQTRVASLSIEGNHAFKEDELLGVVASTSGQPYSDFNVTTDRDNILALYFNEGFPGASFSATAEEVFAASAAKEAIPGNNGNHSKESKKVEREEKKEELVFAQGNAVRLVYKIKEGPQVRVRRLLLSGYQHTRPGVIRREVRIKQKEPLRQGEVVESQRRMYNLGIFNRVTIEPQNPAGSNPDKDIVVLVEEAKRYTLAYGGGFEVQRLASTTNPTGGEVQAAPRGILEFSKLNLTGRADSLSLKLRGSTIEDRALLGYSIPNTFGNQHLSFQATAYTEKTQDINTFTEMRYQGAVQLTDVVNSRTTIVAGYAFRKVLVSNLNSHIAAEEIPLFEQPTLVSEFNLTWIRDTRDNPADASKGSFNSVEASIADTGLGSSASFLRLFYQNSTYHPVKRRFGFARSTRFGILSPYRDTFSLTFPAPTPGECTSPTPPTGPLPAIIPLPERFFAGGGTSLRGFALNQAGPRDPCTGFPVGGQAMLILNQEFRFPMHVPFFGTSLGGAIFYDGGNVFSRVNRITLHSSLPAPTFALQNPALPASPTNLPICATNCTNELNYFAHTIGFGIRYKTPVGPIRIDLGYQLNRPYFVIPIPCPSSSTTCTIGSLGQQNARLPGFQIFFNLGSTF